MTRLISLLGLTFIGHSVVAAQAAPALTAMPDVKSLEAIRRCREQIIRLQLPDGGWRFTAEQADRVRIVPYFGNVAARALAVAQAIERRDGDLERIEKWLDWYASHTRKDGTILDFMGTLESYTPSDKRDSIDTYAPTYLTALWRYWCVQSAEPRPRGRILGRASLALSAIERSIDPSDGLAWSSVPHRVKYPMDNLEICLGLIEGERLLTALGATEAAGRALRLRERCQQALAQFWLADQHHFAWAKGTSKLSASFDKPYPDGVVNLFAAGCVEPPRPGLWEKLQKQFGTSDRLSPDMWLAAAQRCGRQEEARRYHAACLAAAGHEDLTLERAARLLLALAGDLPSPVPVRSL
jgi:hypothetical protein